MRRLLLLLVLLLPVPGLRSAQAMAPQAAVPLDRVLVVVNNGVITSSALDMRMAQVTRQLEAQHIHLPSAAVLRRQVLKRMILDRIQMQVSRRMGIRIHRSQIDLAMEDLASRNHMTGAQFNVALAKDGIDVHEFRRELRTQLVIREIVAHEIRPRVHISGREVRQYLATERQIGQREYHLRDLLIPVHGHARTSVGKAEGLANRLEKKLAKGAQFSELAIAYSQGPKALEGGDLGWKHAGQLPPVFLHALKSMKPGDVSKPIETPDGFHIIKLLKERAHVRKKVVTQTQLRHILIRPSVILSPAAALSRAKRIRSEIKAGVSFGALARRYSDDPMSASEHGDLGWISPGELDPSVEKVMKTLAVGQVSQPIQTAHGIELIEVLGRRKRDISGAISAFQIKQQLEMRRASEMYHHWLDRLRDQAYVRFLAHHSKPTS
ncbi:MAG: peptidylprolyl isomerase [Acidiferrobacteraceae bacterium]